MKKNLPWIITAAVALLLAGYTLRPEPKDSRHWREFGRLPVLVNGRIKPMDTVARTSLLVIHDKQTIRLPEGGRMSAIEWLGELFYAPDRADQRAVFTIHDPDVLGLFGWQQANEKHFTLNQLSPHFDAITRQFELAREVPAQQRSRFQSHIFELFQQLELYQRLKNSLQIATSRDFAGELQVYQSVLAPGVQAMNRREAGETHDEQALNTFLSLAERYRRMAEMAYVHVVPPTDPATAPKRDEWETIGKNLVRVGVTSGAVHPVVMAYAQIGSAYRTGDIDAFNAALARLTSWMNGRYDPEMQRTQHESFFNRYAPFYLAMAVYVLIGVLAFFSWLLGDGVLRRTAFALTTLALVVHTSGLIFRMYLEGRPPVTNLYSSAVFIGWGVVVFGLALEWIFKNGVGAVVSAIAGFCTLLIAHHLSFSGDTMEMMRAVLDSNFWLATHVVVITIGYSTTFLAGLLAIVYIAAGVSSKWLQQPFSYGSSTSGAAAAPPKFRGETNGSALTRMVYGAICFATLFSFVGTVLGGIWADQSWGRFWGWDPKENGAALIVVWNAIILHARWGGYIRERGTMIMAVGGNIVTAWSWFGVNMLGIGLHSYGFMDKAFIWLSLFVGSQIAVMITGGFLRPKASSSPLASRGRTQEMAAPTAATK